jgi:glycosyltransferase 2 family protein
MDKKRFLIYGALLAVLLLLMYMQFRTWRDFDWATFWSQTDHVRKLHIFHSISLIYLAYAIRAFRWKVFLRPVRKVSTAQLFAPTVIGFTGLALLGRPGEMIRPYLIARRLNLPFSSQLAVWTVERIFDIAAFTILLVLTAFVATAPKRLVTYQLFQRAGLLFALLSIGLIIAAIAVHRSGEALAAWVERRFSHWSANLGNRIALRIREFRVGLNTIDSGWSLILLTALSVAMWAIIAVAYKEVTHAYRAPALEIPQSQVLLLMGSSMVGSLIQLPGVGGGSQLATIATLRHVFDVPQELAASCGIMLWLVTFVAVVPLGLFLAHRERLSLRKLSQESHQEENRIVLPSTPPC